MCSIDSSISTATSSRNGSRVAWYRYTQLSISSAQNTTDSWVQCHSGAVRNRQSRPQAKPAVSHWTLTCDETAIRSPGLPFNGLHPVIRVITWITTHLPIPEGWKAELAWLVDLWRTLYPQSGHMSTVDRAKIRESPPAKDRHPNHWATPQMPL